MKDEEIVQSKKPSSWEAILKLDSSTRLQVVDDPMPTQQAFDWELSLMPAQPKTEKLKSARTGRSGWFSRS
jgi:hypothetical protein